ncbi:MAG TPA: nucleotidyltransferase domain-containing protein [Thermoanaerobaculia bacterium]|nr:nucleotidyltransferase domain-containing protein [Thermoanaerobaculia bacterium]
MIHLEPRDRLLVERILALCAPGLEVRAFGSRVHGRHLKPFSDLDLAVVAPQGLAVEELLELKRAFRDSDLPFRVDVIDYSQATGGFRAEIDRAFEILQAAAPALAAHRP